MAEQTKLPTISQTVDDFTRSNSLVVNSKSNRHVLRHTQSQNYGQHKPKVPPTIPEITVENAEDQLTDASKENFKRHSHRKSTPAKKPNPKSETLTLNNNNSYENSNYDGPQPESDIISNKSNFSNKSSRNPSMLSLEVQREQYCCTPNWQWTPRERKLVATVAVLATIIVILVTVVGFMAGGRKGIDQKFQWKF